MEQLDPKVTVLKKFQKVEKYLPSLERVTQMLKKVEMLKGVEDVRRKDRYLHWSRWGLDGRSWRTPLTFDWNVLFLDLHSK